MKIIVQTINHPSSFPFMFVVFFSPGFNNFMSFVTVAFFFFPQFLCSFAFHLHAFCADHCVFLLITTIYIGSAKADLVVSEEVVSTAVFIFLALFKFILWFFLVFISLRVLCDRCAFLFPQFLFSFAGHLHDLCAGHLHDLCAILGVFLLHHELNRFVFF
jgi:hypothetical protein